MRRWRYCDPLSILNTEEMDDADLLKDLSSLGQAAVGRWKRYDVLSIQQRILEKHLSLSRVDRSTEKGFFHWENKSSLAVLKRE